jgi:hypothetical protein
MPHVTHDGREPANFHVNRVLTGHRAMEQGMRDVSGIHRREEPGLAVVPPDGPVKACPKE